MAKPRHKPRRKPRQKPRHPTRVREGNPRTPGSEKTPPTPLKGGADLDVLEQTAALTGQLADRIEAALLADPARLQPRDQQIVDAPEAVAV